MDITEMRRAYAEILRTTADLQLESVVNAFSVVPRERFVGEGPWMIAQPLDPTYPYRTTHDTKLEHIYRDVAIAIDPVRQLNNGQPSAHARWIEAAAPSVGESVLHIGCGLGYYTAILAEMVSLSGRVVAHEVDGDLAARAQVLLQDWPQIDVVQGDASNVSNHFDVIYVNAGATHARSEWLAAMTTGARILLPLTVHLPMFPHGVGFVLRAERRGVQWPARVVSPVGIFDCVGARDEAVGQQLRKLLSPDLSKKIQWLCVAAHEQGNACLLHSEGFCLQS